VHIASKINAALFGAFACGTIATFAVLQSTITPRFEEIERAGAQANHKRITDALEAATEKLQTATQDYAFWDQTYAFLQGQNNDEFIASNLSPEFKAVENLGVNALVFLGSDGVVRWGAAYDLETKEPIEGLIKELAHFSFIHPYVGKIETSTERGLVRTSKGIAFVAVAPALKGDRTGPSVGKVISATLFNAEVIKKLTNVDFSLQPLPDNRAHAILPLGVELKVLAGEMQSASVVNDVIGRPLAILKASSARDVSRAGMMAIHSAMMMMIAAGLAAIGVLWWFLNRSVVARISALKNHFATAGNSGRIIPALVCSGDDEISELAQSFNSMADQANHLRDALADSAYMTGLSEWAAGTLHNVRNGLAPVTTTAWQVEQLFDKTWVKNVEAAAAEHADGKTPADRRLKLNAFLVGSATRFVDAARQTADLTGKINGASRSVLDMVSEFERYAHKKTELEAVDMLPLIGAIGASAIAERSSDTELVLPQVSVTINGNGVILRQIVSNILVNALESIEAQGHRGRIEVSIGKNPRDQGMTRFAISDNGEGLSEGQLTSIFKRGVSTRHNRTGGLGLHWCANAAKVLGGTIRAESRGRGLGATLILDLPNFASSELEAA
jgi:signal transduction histidine kinase